MRVVGVTGAALPCRSDLDPGERIVVAVAGQTVATNLGTQDRHVVLAPERNEGPGRMQLNLHVAKCPREVGEPPCPLRLLDQRVDGGGAEPSAFAPAGGSDALWKA